MKKLVPFLAVLLLYAIPAKANPLDVLPLAPLPAVETALFGGQSGTSGPTFYYVVTAVDANGFESVFSAQATPWRTYRRARSVQSQSSLRIDTTSKRLDIGNIHINEDGPLDKLDRQDHSQATFSTEENSFAALERARFYPYAAAVRQERVRFSANAGS